MKQNEQQQKVWMITGASRGLGAKMAEEALRRGDLVVATARDAAAVTKALGEREELLAVSLDVTKPDTIASGVAAALARFGRIDVLVNNAGFGFIGAVEETTDADVRAQFETNVFGAWSVTRAVLPAMREARSGYVVNVSSIGGVRAWPGYGLYCATKFALEAMSGALHAELAPLGIHVTSLEPGYFRTDFLDASSVREAAAVLPDYDQTSRQTRRHAKEVSYNQPGDPAKLAKVVVDLGHDPKPPMRLALGTDAVGIVTAHHEAALEELRAWRQVSLSTDF